ncbi:MAG: hypothetical protein R2810_06375 [Flavobacteriales bacterium]
MRFGEALRAGVQFDYLGCGWVKATREHLGITAGLGMQARVTELWIRRTC